MLTMPSHLVCTFFAVTDLIDFTTEGLLLAVLLIILGSSLYKELAATLLMVTHVTAVRNPHELQ